MGVDIVQRHAVKAHRRKALVKEKRKVERQAGAVGAGLLLSSESPLRMTGKMSDALADVGEPYLRDCESLTAFQNWLFLAMVGWNVALFPPGKQCDEMYKMFKLVPAINEKIILRDKSLIQALEGCVEEMIFRKEAFYPDDHRVVVSAIARDDGNMYRIVAKYMISSG
jgi:hypothetical protein